MSDTGEVFRDFQEAKRQERAAKEPGRIGFAVSKLKVLGCDYHIERGDLIVIEIGCGRIDFWPFTGWFCGRKPLLGKIKGRGIRNLVREIKMIQSKG